MGVERNSSDLNRLMEYCRTFLGIRTIGPAVFILSCAVGYLLGSVHQPMEGIFHTYSKPFKAGEGESVFFEGKHLRLIEAKAANGTLVGGDQLLGEPCNGVKLNEVIDQSGEFNRYPPIRFLSVPQSDKFDLKRTWIQNHVLKINLNALDRTLERDPDVRFYVSDSNEFTVILLIAEIKRPSESTRSVFKHFLFSSKSIHDPHIFDSLAADPRLIRLGENSLSWIEVGENPNLIRRESAPCVFYDGVVAMSEESIAVQ